MTLVDETISASALPTSAFKWLMELQVPSANYDQFASFDAPDGTRFETLDAKLAFALVRIANNEFGKMIETKKFEAMTRRSRITGRQIVYMLDQHFRMFLYKALHIARDHFWELLRASIHPIDPSVTF